MMSRVELRARALALLALLKRGWRPRLMLPVIFVTTGLFIATLMFALRPAPESQPKALLAPLVTVQTLVSEPVRFVVKTQGTVVPRTESALVPQVAGEVVWVSPALVAGGFFEQGDMLVRIDDADARATVTRARAVLTRTRSEEARATKERERQQRLAEQDIASQTRIDDTENAYRIAFAMRSEAVVALEKAERDLSRTQLRAPYAGRVRSKSVDVGQFVDRGKAIATLYAVDHAEVRLPVPDRELGYLEVPLTYRPPTAADPATDDASADGEEARAGSASGPLVTLRARFAGAEHSWRGRIARTEGEIDPKSRMVTLVAQVEDPYAEHESRPPLAVGLFVSAEIEGATVPEAFVLPRVALREGGRVLVFEDGRLRFRRVEVLRVERERVVVASGLQSGEQVCVTPLSQAIDGMAVRTAEGQGAMARAAGDESGT